MSDAATGPVWSNKLSAEQRHDLEIRVLECTTLEDAIKDNWSYYQIVQQRVDQAQIAAEVARIWFTTHPYARSVPGSIVAAIDSLLGLVGLPRGMRSNIMRAVSYAAQIQTNGADRGQDPSSVRFDPILWDYSNRFSGGVIKRGTHDLVCMICGYKYSQHSVPGGHCPGVVLPAKFEHRPNDKRMYLQNAESCSNCGGHREGHHTAEGFCRALPAAAQPKGDAP